MAECEGCGLAHHDDMFVVGMVSGNRVVDSCGQCGETLRPSIQPASWRRLEALEETASRVIDAQAYALTGGAGCESRITGRFDKPCREWTFDHRKWCYVCQLMNDIDEMRAAFSGWSKVQPSERGDRPRWVMNRNGTACEIVSSEGPNQWKWSVSGGAHFTVADTLGEAVDCVREALAKVEHAQATSTAVDWSLQPNGFLTVDFGDGWRGVVRIRMSGPDRHTVTSLSVVGYLTSEGLAYCHCAGESVEDVTRRLEAHHRALSSAATREETDA